MSKRKKENENDGKQNDDKNTGRFGVRSITEGGDNKFGVRTEISESDKDK